MNIGSLPYEKRRYNKLLFQYRKDKKRLQRLIDDERNLNRQVTLKKRLSRIYKQLIAILKRFRKAIAIGVISSTFLLGAENANSQAFVNAQTFEGSTQGTTNLVDFDGDGDLDLHITGSIYTYFDVKNDIYLNDGSGNFTKFTGNTYSFYDSNFQGVYAADVEFADIDVDGDIDIAFTGFGYLRPFSGNVSKVYLNDLDNSGTFIEATTNPFNLLTPYALAVGDVTGENDVDFIIGTFNDFKQFVNDGSGNFTEDVNMPALEVDSGVIKLIDADGDGDFDIVVSTSRFYPYNDKVTKLFINDGSGGFTEVANSGLELQSYSYNIIVADFDNDGDSDLFLPTSESKLFLNNDTNPVSFTPTPDNTLPSSIVLTIDFDGDGDIDILSGSEKIYLNDGSGQFELEDSFQIPEISGSSPAMGDIDNDGDIDLVIQGVYNSAKSTVVFFNENPPMFTSTNTVVTSDNETGIILDVNAIEQDGNSTPDENVTYSLLAGGDNEFFTINASSGELSFIVPPDFEFPEDSDKNNEYLVTVIASDAGGSTQQEIAVNVVARNERLWVEDTGFTTEVVNISQSASFDVDGDGDLDLILSGRASNYVDQYFKILLNNGEGSFTESTTSGINDSREDFIYGDVDNDSDIDIIIFRKGLYLNNGSGSFALDPDFPSVSANYTSAFIDFDGDSDLDILQIFAPYSGETSRYLTNDASGSFTQTVAANFPSTMYLNSINVFDADGDSDMDLFLSGRNTGFGFSGIIADFFINTGVNSGTFQFDTENDFYAGLAYGGSSTVGDVDMDGDIDIYYTGQTFGFYLDRTQYFRINNGENPPLFESASLGASSPASAYGECKFVDVDNDGDLDLFVAGETATVGSISNLLKNDGSGTFTLDNSANIPTTSRPEFTFFDADGDGDQDLFFGGGGIAKLFINSDPLSFENSNSFSINENQTGATFDINAAELGNSPDVMITYSLARTGDFENLSIDPTTGVITANTSFDFENPVDLNSDNILQLVVTADNDFTTLDQAISISIQDVNDNPPEFPTVNISPVNENEVDVVVLTATDADNSSVLTYSITGGADQGDFSINTNTGALTFVNAPDFENPSDNNSNNEYLVTITVSDGTFSDDIQLSIDVTDVNDNQPEFQSASLVSINENISTVLDINATDEDQSDVITYSISGGVDQALFSINNSTGIISFVNAPDFEDPKDDGLNNEYFVQVAASDGVNTTTQDLAISVNNLNDNDPVFTSTGSISVEENSAAIQILSATDSDALNTLFYSLSGGDDIGDISINTTTGQLTFNDPPDFENPSDNDNNNIYDITVTVSDGTRTANLDVNVAVTDLNDNAPVFTSAGSFNFSENASSIIGMVETTDADQNNVVSYSFTAGSDQDLFEINTNTGEISFKEIPDFENPSDANGDNQYEVQVNANDGVNDAAQNITISVQDDNDAPVSISLANKSFTAFEPIGTTIGTLETADQDASDTHTYQIISGSRFSLEGTSLQTADEFTNEDVGSFIVTITSTDAGGETVTDTVTVFVNEFVDLESPQFTNLTEISTFESGGNSITLSVDVTDFSLQEVLFNYRTLTSSEFISEPTVQDQDTYSYTINESLLDGVGIIYYFSASDLAGNTEQTDEVKMILNFPENSDTQAEIELDQNRFGQDVSNYQLISVPFILSNSRVDNIFDEFGSTPGVPDGSSWRLIRFDVNSQDIVDIGPSYSIRLGEGYFFIAQEAAELNVTGAQVNTTEPETISLRPGWNLIGNPYVKNLDWNAILTANNATADVMALRVINSTASPSSTNEYWPESNVLRAFEGAFVFAMSTVDLEINYLQTTDANSRTDLSAVEYDFDWFVPLTVSGSKIKATGGVGMHRNGSSGFDVYDKPNVPRVSNFIELKSMAGGRDIARNITGIEANQEWEFTIESNDGDNVILTWPEIDNGLNLRLLNKSNGRMIDMRETNKIIFKAAEQMSFKVLFSSNPFQNFLKEQLEVLKPFPNPATDEFIIPVSLPSNESFYAVDIDFFDISGRKLESVNLNLNAGRHDINIKSDRLGVQGVLMYEMRIKAEGIEKTFKNKLIIKK